MNVVLDNKRSNELGKAAQILLDEAETAQPTDRVKLNTKARVRRRGERTDDGIGEEL